MTNCEHDEYTICELCGHFNAIECPYYREPCTLCEHNPLHKCMWKREDEE